MFYVRVLAGRKRDEYELPSSRCNTGRCPSTSKSRRGDLGVYLFDVLKHVSLASETCVFLRSYHGTLGCRQWASYTSIELDRVISGGERVALLKHKLRSIILNFISLLPLVLYIHSSFRVLDIMLRG